jgi:hypothetical protein
MAGPNFRVKIVAVTAAAQLQGQSVSWVTPRGGALYDQSAHVIVVTGRGAGSVLRNSCAASGILSPDKFVSQERRANHNCGLHTSHYSTLPS